MDYGPSDSSGTDDDLPPTHQNRIRAAPRITGNGRAGMLGNLTYNRVQNDVESEVHWLEQEAYSSVLKAFKAQADVITWEQAELMSALRKELRVSDDEHRKLLGRVNTDDVVSRIREWRKSGSIQHNVHATAQPGHEPAPSPSVSASRKKQKTSHSAASLSLGAPSPALQTRIVAAAPMHPSSSVAKHGAVVGTRGKKPKSGHAGVGVDSMLSSQHVSGGPARQGGQIARRGASLAGVQVEPKASASFDPLIGRKVRTRWPEDNNFYEAVITDYNPKEGLHALVYDMNTNRETWEWVNLKEISPEDIRWEGEDPGVTGRGRGGLGRGMKKSMPRGASVTGIGRGRGAPKSLAKKEFPPSQNGFCDKGTDKIEILHTESLINEVERIFDGSHPDAAEMERAKNLLKEHELSLLDAISNISRLEDASDGESDGEHPLAHGQSFDEETRWRNQQSNAKQRNADFKDTAGVGRGDGSEGHHMAGEGGVPSGDLQDGDDGSDG